MGTARDSATSAGTQGRRQILSQLLSLNPGRRGRPCRAPLGPPTWPSRPTHRHPGPGQPREASRQRAGPGGGSGPARGGARRPPRLRPARPLAPHTPAAPQGPAEARVSPSRGAPITCAPRRQQRTARRAAGRSRPGEPGQPRIPGAVGRGAAAAGAGTNRL